MMTKRSLGLITMTSPARTLYTTSMGYVLCMFLLSLTTQVLASSCQHDCDCSFDWTKRDDSTEDISLRYEVMAGLTGGFAPLALGGLSLLVYKLCTKGAANALSSAGMAPGNPYMNGPWGGGRGNSAGFPAYDRRGSTPISLYGETEDDFITRGPASQTGRPGTMNSRYTNVHRNVKSDLINQWFRNVNLKKY